MPPAEKRGVRTLAASDNPAVVQGMKARNNGRYNGNGRKWATPPEVFVPLHAEFGFTLDACAEAATAKVPRFYAEKEDEPGALGVDGLAHSWAGERVFMNPPYGREVAAWTRKARTEAGGGCPLIVGLVPASTDLRWWHEDIEPGRLSGGVEVRFPRGRPRFLTDKALRASAFQPSAVVIWRGSVGA